MNENPGGWPTGPLLTEWQYQRRDNCNATADLRDVVAHALRIDRFAVWLSNKLGRFMA